MRTVSGVEPITHTRSETFKFRKEDVLRMLGVHYDRLTQFVTFSERDEVVTVKVQPVEVKLHPLSLEE